MFSIVKLPTKKLLFGAALALIYVLPSLANAQEFVTRLELQSMQTRKFMKGPEAVANAIEGLAKDTGGTCPSMVMLVKSHLAIKSYNKVSGTSCIDKVGKADSALGIQSLRTDYEFSWDSSKKFTILRARIYVNTVQSENPTRYQRLFKDIADSLFIDAIEINPSVMN